MRGAVNKKKAVCLFSVRLISVPLFGLILISCASLRNINPLALVVKKGRPFEIMSTKNAYGWGVISHPFIGPMRMDEPMYVTYNLAGDWGGKEHALSETKAMGPAISLDHGKTWAYGKDALPQEFSYLAYRSRIETKDGNYCYADCPNQKSGVTKAVWVRDGVAGEPFSVPTRVSFGFSKEYRLMFRGVERKDGCFLIAAMTIPGSGPNKGEWISFTMISTNRGVSFEDYGIIADKSQVPTGVLDGPNESDMMRCTNGDLLCIIRTGMTKRWGANPLTDMGSMLIAHSKNDGDTWDVKPLGIPGVNPHVIRLQNGVLVLAYGRPGNNLAFSVDDGYTWGHELALTAADVKTSGYVAITEVEPNRIMAVYDVHDTDTSGIWLWEPKEVNGVFGCFVDVKRLWGGAPESGGRRSEIGRRMSDEGAEEKGTGSPVKKVIDLRP